LTGAGSAAALASRQRFGALSAIAKVASVVSN
jgi:hypothetical protein